MSETVHFDAVLVGGGLSGLAAAAALARAGIEFLHVAPKASADARTSALMGPSIDWLKQAGLIGTPGEIGVPLTRIRIIDATSRLVRAPETLFDSSEAGLEAFGWNCPNARLLQAFAAMLDECQGIARREATLEALERHHDRWHLTLSDGAQVATPFLVGADGKASRVREGAEIRARETRYGEAALVADLELDRALDGTSVEFHYEHGPFTLVPAGGNKANLVWIDERGVLESARAQDATNLASLLGEKSQRLFGHVRPAGPAHVFPLSSLTVATAGRNGAVLVGEAAHAFPPIGAQGLNLGLRDVADLGEALAAIDPKRPGWAETVSRDYAARRAADLARTGAVVDALFRSLLADMLPAQALRAGGLWVLRSAPALRRRAFRLGMGGN